MSAPRFAELFAGVGGLGMGLERAGMHGVWRAELADFPRRVLRHRYPDAPLYGDVSTLDGAALVAAHGPFDLLAGGSPCQDLSVAGKRAGLAGARSGLFHEQVRLWNETGATYCLWENVLGALSSNTGADFAAVLSAFVGAAVPVPADGWGSAGVVAGPTGVAAWRVLDAQWFGVPQRRRRVFVLAARAGGVDPAAVLLEPDGMRWDSPPRREAGERIADSLTVGANQTCGFPGDVVAGDDGNGGGLDAIAFREKLGAISAGRVSPALMAATGATGNMHPSVVTFNETGFEAWREQSIAGALNAHEATEAHTLIVGTLNGTQRCQVDGAMAVQESTPRRLLPVECERLMSWPDGWTDVPDAKGKPASDAVRYKACGNGVASCVTAWIGARFVEVAA